MRSVYLPGSLLLSFFNLFAFIFFSSCTAKLAVNLVVIPISVDIMNASEKIEVIILVICFYRMAKLKLKLNLQESLA